MSSINVKFLSADQRIKYETESFPDAKFNEFITELYDIILNIMKQLIFLCIKVQVFTMIAQKN